jgi:hypothetical protein
MTPSALDHGHRHHRRTVGVSASSARNALTITARPGGTPTRGRATSRAPKIEARKNTAVAHGRGSTTARYQGSNVASRTRAASRASTTTLPDVGVVLAQ